MKTHNKLNIKISNFKLTMKKIGKVPFVVSILVLLAQIPQLTQHITKESDACSCCSEYYWSDEVINFCEMITFFSILYLVILS